MRRRFSFCLRLGFWLGHARHVMTLVLRNYDLRKI
jgi:hypothetical protein